LPAVDISLTIGGDAGQGVESSGAAFSRVLARGGLHVFSLADYRSRIRGGHNFYQIRAADWPVHAHADPVHLLVALTEETVRIHLDQVAPGGGVIYDESFGVRREEVESRGLRGYPLPLARLAEAHGSKVMTNTGALGAAAALLDYPVERLEEIVRENFRRKGEAVVQRNLAVLREAHRLGREARGDFPFRLPVQTSAPRRMLLHGNHAFALGAVAGGCRFISAYPMTPATSLFEWMTAHAGQLGVVTKHAEDEIAAMCMAVGAGHAGARAMTCTSGGGFSLMVEALGMAGMCEVPVVVLLCQRGGPSTGLPTRTEQGDLLFALHASQGEFPRIVLAPGTLEQCFEAGWRSFNLAERYQCPVIVLSDQFLASSLRTVEPGLLDLGQVRIDRGKTLTDAELDRATGPYLRYALTPDGISPRAIPGHPRGVYAVTTDEHDEEGHITEEIANRRRMMEKRMRKLDAARAEMRGPQWYGPEGADLTLICWGSMYGPVREAVDILESRGIRANMLHFSDIWPFPAEAAMAQLRKVRRSVGVEQNYTSQFLRLLRAETGFVPDGAVNKYDGRPPCPREIAERVEQEAGVRV
jgi:2-oxoglutarate ferredoxin oxidoreductase subunit alpha